MQIATMSRTMAFAAVGAIVLLSASSCNANKGTAPSLVQRNETFTGTLQPLGFDAKNFTVSFTAAATELSVVVNSLTTVAGATPVTGITIGVGLGVPALTGCSVQLISPATTLGQQLTVPNGVPAGNYCVQISDCPAGTAGCSSTLSEAVTYSMTVKHY